MNKPKRLVCFLGVLFLTAPALGQYTSPWPAIRDFGGATPKNLNSWVGAEDYPSVALRRDQQGNVIVAFDITAEGRADNCVVETSSGIEALDKVPCKLIERNARFTPASDAKGAPSATKARYSVAFWIPGKKLRP